MTLLFCAVSHKLWLLFSTILHKTTTLLFSALSFKPWLLFSALSHKPWLLFSDLSHKPWLLFSALSHKPWLLFSALSFKPWLLFSALSHKPWLLFSALSHKPQILFTGEYYVSIKFNDEHIPDSPFRVPITPSIGDARKISISALQDKGLQVGVHDLCLNLDWLQLWEGWRPFAITRWLKNCTLWIWCQGVKNENHDF